MPLSPELRALCATRPLEPAAVLRFAETHGIPLVSGDRVTFLYFGEAEAVYLKHWIWGLDGSLAFERVEGTELWRCELELPPRSRVEYKIEVVRDGHGEWMLDPLNPRRAHDPFGANSVCHATGYATPDWCKHDPGVRPGTLDAMLVQSDALGDAREVPLYVPARFRRGRRYPMLIVHDGTDFLRYAALKTVLDNLVDRLEVAPLVVALTNPGERLREYAGDERHSRHLVQEMTQALEQRFDIWPGPWARGLCGASLGAVASLAAAWHHPGSFGRLALLSGSFAFSDVGRHRRGPEFDPVVELMNEFRDSPALPAERIFLACGMHESLIYENRSIVPVLQRTGAELRYVEARDGHNWENWRDRLREGLSWLFPGPLWMTYE